jgi:hypothetical protein
MRKICLVCLVHESFDIANIIKTALAELQVDVELIKVPHFSFSDLTSDRLLRLKKLLQLKALDQFVIFFPDTTELFLQEADFMLVYSAYRSWFSPKKMRVIPHLWTPVGLPAKVDDLTWKEKPPLRIGFMGRLHGTSRLASFILKVPNRLKKWLLQGNHLRHANLIAQLNELGISILNVNTFPRIEAFQILLEKSQDRDIAADLEIFGGTEQEICEYKNHLKKNTYIICARGSENYSFRLYETLNYGRIPVIVDTEMVLPKEINWDRLSIVVPYNGYKSLEGIYDAILRDYESRSANEFFQRQREAFSAMTELRTMRWVRGLAKDIAKTAGLP